MLNFFEKKAFCGFKSQIFVIGDKNAGHEALRRSMRHGDDFDWLGGHSAKKEAPEVSSWNLRAHGVSTPPPSYSIMISLKTAITKLTMK